jgi:hypothetical protein
MKICPTCGQTHNWFPILQRISPDDPKGCSRAPFYGASAAAVSFALSDSTQFRHSRELSRSRESRDPLTPPQHPPDPSEGADIPANQQGGEGWAAANDGSVGGAHHQNPCRARWTRFRSILRPLASGPSHRRQNGAHWGVPVRSVQGGEQPGRPLRKRTSEVSASKFWNMSMSDSPGSERKGMPGRNEQ